MIEKDRIIKVTNRDNGTVGYTIPDLGNLHRLFQPGETKNLPYEELEKLSWVSGGRAILMNCLKIDDKEAIEELLGKVEPEYFYTEKEVKKLLKDGSLEQLEDCLDYAPEGVIELVKDIAVKEKLDGTSKREAILKATGFDVSSAIEINKDTQENATTDNKKENQRRSAPITISKDEKSGRRAGTIKIIE